MTWIDFVSQRSRSQQAVNMAKASMTTLGRRISSSSYNLTDFARRQAVSLRNSPAVIAITSRRRCLQFPAITQAASSGKSNVTVCRPSVRLSACPVGILTVTHQGAAINGLVQNACGAGRECGVFDLPHSNPNPIAAVALTEFRPAPHFASTGAIWRVQPKRRVSLQLPFCADRNVSFASSC